MQTKFFLSGNGQEVQLADINQIASEAALADDVVFAEFFRLAQSARAIIPYGFGTARAAGIVSNGGGTITGGLCVNPFRAAVNMSGYTNIRSAMYVNASGTTTERTITIGAQSAGVGTTRIDLVYATLYVDANDAAASRFFYGNATPSSVVINQKTYATVSVVAGTASTTPALPTLPADPAGGYNIPLAYINVANGFTSSSVVPATSIMEIAPCVQSNYWHDVRPANRLNTTGTPFFDGKTKGSYFLPPSMEGKAERFLAYDGTVTSGLTADNSTNWRNRLFKVSAQVVAGSGLFAWSSTNPIAVPNGATPMTFIGSSCGASDPTICTFTNANTGGVVASGASVALKVSVSTGEIYYAVVGTPGVTMVAWLEASAPITNLV